METHEILIKPAVNFAFVKVFFLIVLSLTFLFLGYTLSPYFILFSFLCIGMAFYRYLYIRNCEYLVTGEIIRISRGLFFKRIDQVELFRVKDYIITQPLILRILGLMNVTLKSKDIENPVIWLRGIPVSNLIDVMRERVNDARQHNRIYEIN